MPLELTTCPIPRLDRYYTPRNPGTVIAYFSYWFVARDHYDGQVIDMQTIQPPRQPGATHDLA